MCSGRVFRLLTQNEPSASPSNLPLSTGTMPVADLKGTHRLEDCAGSRFAAACLLISLINSFTHSNFRTVVVQFLNDRGATINISP